MRAAFDNDGALTFRPRHWPISSAASVTGLSIAWTAQWVTNYDPAQVFVDGNVRLCSVPSLVVLPSSGNTNIVAPVPNRHSKGQVRVTYQAGYAYSALPGDLKEAAILVTSDIIGKRHNPIGAAQVNSGGINLVTYLRGDLTGESGLIKRAAHILAKYAVELY